MLANGNPIIRIREDQSPKCRWQQGCVNWRWRHSCQCGKLTTMVALKLGHHRFVRMPGEEPTRPAKLELTNARYPYVDRSGLGYGDTFILLFRTCSSRSTIQRRTSFADVQCLVHDASAGEPIAACKRPLHEEERAPHSLYHKH